MANNSCNTKGFDICKKAREISDEMAKNLPMQLNKNMSIQTVAAIQNVIIMTAVFSYDRARLDLSLKQAGMSQGKMDEIMKNAARDSICASKSESQAFVILGGVIRYIYKFIDGKTYKEITISSC